MLVSWSIPSSLSQPRPLDFFRVDRMSLKSFLSLQVSTQVPGELLTEVGHMCKSRVESCHVFDWLEYFFGWENTMILGSFGRYQLHQWRPSSKVNVWMVPMEVGFYFPGRKGRDLHCWYAAMSQVLLLVGKAQVVARIELFTDNYWDTLQEWKLSTLDPPFFYILFRLQFWQNLPIKSFLKQKQEVQPTASTELMPSTSFVVRHNFTAELEGSQPVPLPPGSLMVGDLMLPPLMAGRGAENTSCKICVSLYQRICVFQNLTCKLIRLIRFSKIRNLKPTRNFGTFQFALHYRLGRCYGTTGATAVPTGATKTWTQARMCWLHVPYLPTQL